MGQYKIDTYLIHSPALTNEITLEVVTTRSLTTFEWILLETLSHFEGDSISWGEVVDILALGQDNLFVMETLQELIDLDVLYVLVGFDIIHWPKLKLNQFQFTQTGKEIFLQGKLQGRPSTHKETIYKDEISGQIALTMSTQSAAIKSSHAITDGLWQRRLEWDQEEIKNAVEQGSFDYLKGETYITNIRLGSDNNVWQHHSAQLCLSREKGFFWQRDKKTPANYQMYLDSKEIWESPLGKKALEDFSQIDDEISLVEKDKIFLISQNFDLPSNFGKNSRKILLSCHKNKFAIINNCTDEIEVPCDLNSCRFSRKTEMKVVWKNEGKNFDIYIPSQYQDYPLVISSEKTVALLSTKIPLFSSTREIQLVPVTLAVLISPEASQRYFNAAKELLTEKLHSWQSSTGSECRDILLAQLAFGKEPFEIWKNSPKESFEISLDFWKKMLSICKNPEVMRKFLEDLVPINLEEIQLCFLAHKSVKKELQAEKIEKWLQPHLLELVELLVKNEKLPEEIEYCLEIKRILNNLKEIPRQDRLWQEISIPSESELEEQAFAQTKTSNKKKKSKGDLQKQIDVKKIEIMQSLERKFQKVLQTIQLWNEELLALKKLSPKAYDLVKKKYCINERNVVNYLRDREKEVEIFFSKHSSNDETKVLVQNIKSTNEQKLLENVSRSMNLRDIKKTNQQIKTILKASSNPKIAVIELSTKAVKLLISQESNILDLDFNFKNFLRETQLVHAGKGLSSDNIMDIKYFRSRVVPAIKKMVKICQKESVHEIYSVATAAYRSANNRDEVTDIIRKECKLNVEIISKEKETELTVKAFLFCKPPSVQLNSEIIMLIDQGGGSTEISFLTKDGNEILNSYSLNLGTTVLHNVFFGESNKSTSFEKALHQVKQVTKERLRHYFQNHAPDYTSLDCIGVGTAITFAAGKKNKLQHGKILTEERIQKREMDVERELLDRFSSIKELKQYLDKITLSGGSDTKWIDKKFSTRLGLPMYRSLIDYFNISQITVSGTGLWYGVYFENLKEIRKTKNE